VARITESPLSQRLSSLLADRGAHEYRVILVRHYECSRAGRVLSLLFQLLALGGVAHPEVDMPDFDATAPFTPHFAVDRNAVRRHHRVSQLRRMVHVGVAGASSQHERIVVAAFDSVSRSTVVLAGIRQRSTLVAIGVNYRTKSAQPAARHNSSLPRPGQAEEDQQSCLLITHDSLAILTFRSPLPPLPRQCFCVTGTGRFCR
jgi:hypothetical protein